MFNFTALLTKHLTCDLSKKTVVSCEEPVVQVQPRVSEEPTVHPGVDVSTVPSTRQLFSDLPVFRTKNDDGDGVR